MNVKRLTAAPDIFKSGPEESQDLMSRLRSEWRLFDKGDFPSDAFELLLSAGAPADVLERAIADVGRAGRLSEYSGIRDADGTSALEKFVAVRCGRSASR